MKNLLILIVCSFLSPLYCLNAQSINDEYDMQAFARNFMKAYNQQDHDAIRTLYMDDALRIDQEGKEMAGADQIAAYFAEQFRMNNATLLLKQQSIGWSDYEHAFVAKGTYEVYGTTYIYDIPIHITGAYANTMIKEDGNWKIAKSVLTPQTGPGSEQVRIIDGLYQAFSKGDIPTVLAGLDDNVVWNEAEGNAYADGNPYIGPDAVLNGVIARIGEDHEYFNLTNLELHGMSNDQVLATLRYNAKLKKNGEPYDAQAAHLWTLKDGKVVAFQQYVDTKKLNEAFSK